MVMSNCPRTGLGVPECSCKRCVEEMLRRVQPDVFGGEIRVVRSSTLEASPAHADRPH
jgi:hypothetical protein